MKRLQETGNREQRYSSHTTQASKLRSSCHVEISKGTIYKLYNPYVQLSDTSKGGGFSVKRMNRGLGHRDGSGTHGSGSQSWRQSRKSGGTENDSECGTRRSRDWKTYYGKVGVTQGYWSVTVVWTHKQIWSIAHSCDRNPMPKSGLVCLRRLQSTASMSTFYRVQSLGETINQTR